LTAVPTHAWETPPHHHLRSQNTSQNLPATRATPAPVTAQPCASPRKAGPCASAGEDWRETGQSPIPSYSAGSHLGTPATPPLVVLSTLAPPLVHPMWTGTQSSAAWPALSPNQTPSRAVDQSVSWIRTVSMDTSVVTRGVLRGQTPVYPTPVDPGPCLLTRGTAAPVNVPPAPWATHTRPAIEGSV